MPTTFTAGGASDSLALSSGNDGLLTLQTGPSGAKVNALALDASGNGALLGVLTQAGSATPRMQLLTPISLISGTTGEYLSLPTWVKRVTMLFDNLSTTGTANYVVQMGSGAFLTSTYFSRSCPAGGSGGNSTTGFLLQSTTAAADTLCGSYVFNNISGNTWLGEGQFLVNTSANYFASGRVALSGTLDRIRVITTDAFDGAGSINLLLEGY